MDIADFNKLVENAKNKHPFWFEGERESPINASEIDEFERFTGCSLPEQYKFFVSKYGCGYFALTSIYSLRKGEWDIFDKIQLIPDLQGKFLPISDNGCGDYYGFVIEDSKCSDTIYFADHESGYALTPTEYDDLLSFILEIGLKP